MTQEFDTINTLQKGIARGGRVPDDALDDLFYGAGLHEKIVLDESNGTPLCPASDPRANFLSCIIFRIGAPRGCSNLASI